MSDAGIFDLGAIRQSCWQTCESDPGAFPMDLAGVPAYRHDDTREEFFGVATFFGCVDICEDDYRVKRIAFFVPIAVIGGGWGEEEPLTDPKKKKTPVVH